MIAIAEQEPGFSYLERKISYRDARGTHQSVVVDIVANNGATWIKVTARNARGLLASWEGDSSFGKKSIVSVCDELLLAARCNPIKFAMPLIHFIFAAGLPPVILQELQGIA